jgi:hypothetical protein
VQVLVRHHHFDAWQVEPLIGADPAKHQGEQSCHQQWDAEHKDHREQAAEGSGKVFQGDIQGFHFEC